MNESTEWLRIPSALLDEAAQLAAQRRQQELTKPPGALGELETIAIRLAAMQGTPRPALEQIAITIFAADHGVAAEGVSAFPQSVTGEMVRNFARGGAAICVLARSLDAQLEVINLGTVNDLGSLPGVLNLRLGPGSANLSQSPAMTDEQLARAMHAGRQAVERAKLAGAQLFIGGEMGIGNTTAATALACALLDAVPEQIAGPGTGLSLQGVEHKIEVIRRALALHQKHLGHPIQALRRLGGFEIAALAGSYMACAHIGLPALVDGFISSVAALVATRLCDGAGEWLLFAHASAEPGHRRVLKALAAQPLLDIGMRLGEGSGAATAVPLLRLACSLHNEMATFAEAEVSEKQP